MQTKPCLRIACAEPAQSLRSTCHHAMNVGRRISANILQYPSKPHRYSPIFAVGPCWTLIGPCRTLSDLSDLSDCRTVGLSDCRTLGRQWETVWDRCTTELTVGWSVGHCRTVGLSDCRIVGLLSDAVGRYCRTVGSGLRALHATAGQSAAGPTRDRATALGRPAVDQLPVRRLVLPASYATRGRGMRKTAMLQPTATVAALAMA